MKNEYKVTKALISSWAKEFHLHGASNIILLVLWCFMGFCGAAGTVFSILIHSDPLDVYFFVLIFLVSVYKLFFERFVIWSRRYKLYVKTYGVTEWIRSTEFLEDEIILTDHTTTMQYRYDQITEIKENNNTVLLFFKNKTATRLYKDAFVEGSWQECRELIRAKTGK